jgi:endonuclease/exonuclease/phosphatase family metal-dependent hydrolase
LKTFLNPKGEMTVISKNSALVLFIMTVACAFASLSVAYASDSFTVVSWNVGHHARGVKRYPAIPPGRDGEFRAKCLKFIGGARIAGLSEYSHMFSTNSTATTAETLFSGYALKLEGTDMFPQCNSIFVMDGKLLETRERRYPKRKRAKYYKFARVELDGHEVCIIVTHLDFDTGPDDPLREARADQMRTIIADMAKEKYVIVCGDFNISPRSGDTKDHAAEYDVFADAGYTLAHRGGLVTWPAHKGSNRECGLDNIMVKGFEMSDVRTESYPTFSDHRLLSCRLKFKD